MKKYIFAFIASLLVFGLWSCSEDNELSTAENGRSVKLTVYATRDGMETETRATLNEVNGNLNCSWEEGDQLFVTSTNGNVLGQLSLVNKEEGKFEGTLIGLNEDKMALNYFYLGSGTNLEAVNGSYNVNIASQDGTMKSLTKNDVLSAQTEVVIIDGNAYVTGALTLARYFSFGHFTLTFPEGVSMNGESIAITGANLMTQASVNLADRSLSGQTAGTITVTGTNGDFYINLIPASGVTPTFKVTIGNTEYEGTLKARDIAAGIYLRDSGIGVPIEMEKTEEPVVDHSKNPLLKWAEADLVYNNGKNSIASSYTIQGSLYQWGRNIGWADYKDALGELVTANGRRYYEYATYSKHYYTGTGIMNGYDDQSDYSYDNQNDSFTEALYFMNPNGTDYWIGSGGGSTWDEREVACGFTSSVCPTGWRMPAEADFLEIKPSEPLSGSESLASVVNRMELRTIEGVCSYAIRWTAETESNKTYLRIDAMVVPDNFTEDNLGTIDWTDKNVVTRYFGANGFIHAFYHVNIVTGNQQFPVARPMPGTETHTDRLWQNGSYWTVLWDYITDYSKNNEGYYWMSDKKEAFTFQDNTRVKNAEKMLGTQPTGEYPFKNRQSVLGFLATDAQDCCAIRCVKAN